MSEVLQFKPRPPKPVYEQQFFSQAELDEAFEKARADAFRAEHERIRAIFAFDSHRGNRWFNRDKL